MQSAKRKMQNAKCAIQNAKCKVQSAKCKMLGRRRLVCVGLTLSFALCTLHYAFSSPNGSRVQCANLVYAVHKTSRCFSDRFMKRLESETRIVTDGKLVRTPLAEARRM